MSVRSRGKPVEPTAGGEGSGEFEFKTVLNSVAGSGCAVEATPEPLSNRRDSTKMRFAIAFRELLITLEEASAYGPARSLSLQYGALRKELRRSYPRLRDQLRESLPEPEEDGRLGFDFHGIWSDPFERLLRSETLEEALRAPATRVAQESQRASEALRRWELDQEIGADV